MLRTPEDRARAQIETQLIEAGWMVQDAEAIHLAAAQGIAVREFPLGKAYGTADYLLYGDRSKLLHECDVHTLLRLPTGIFYAQGVKANVLFFDRRPAGETPQTKTLWIYDLRTNKSFTLKTNPLKRADLDDFVDCYNPGNRHDRTPAWSDATPEGRWRSYSYEELLQRDKVSLDIFWLRDESLEDSANLPDPDMLAAEIAEDLQAALDQFAQIAEDLAPHPAARI